MLAWKLIPVVPQVLIRHGQVGGPHAGRVRGWRGASSDERHVLVAWVPAEQRGLVHVLRDGGIGDGLGWVQAALAAQAAAVAAEAAKLPRGGLWVAMRRAWGLKGSSSSMSS